MNSNPSRFIDDHKLISMKNSKAKFSSLHFLTLLILLFNSVSLLAQETQALMLNVEENKVPPYSLPELLLSANGKKITNSKDWKTIRRPEIIQLFTKEMYGFAPKKHPKMKFMLLESSDNALQGIAKRKQIRVLFNGKSDGPFMDILIYLPKQTNGPVPLITGLNFQGNHAVIADESIPLSQNWIPKKGVGVVNNHATEASRGVYSFAWPIEKMLKRGYGVATMYAGDIDPDFDDGFKNGIHALYPHLQKRQDNFSTIAAWAWGLSRAMDYFETDKAINAKQVVLTGFSRMGKAALWAGALDERFAIVISNESGKGGAALMKRQFGENVKKLNTIYPHWFNHRFKQYSDNEQNLPFDQHMLLALIAPRPLYIGSAADDDNADPKGEFLSLKAAEPVYQLYGIKGINSTTQPPINQPQYGTTGYHIRDGGHSMTEFDWNQYLDFSDKNLNRKND